MLALFAFIVFPRHSDWLLLLLRSLTSTNLLQVMLSLGISTQLLKQACGVYKSSVHPDELVLLAQRSMGELRAAVLMLLAAQLKVFILLAHK